jgi:hypothetical protein
LAAGGRRSPAAASSSRASSRAASISASSPTERHVHQHAHALADGDAGRTGSLGPQPVLAPVQAPARAPSPAVHNVTAAAVTFTRSAGAAVSPGMSAAAAGSPLLARRRGGGVASPQLRVEARAAPAPTGLTIVSAPESRAQRAPPHHSEPLPRKTGAAAGAGASASSKPGAAASRASPSPSGSAKTHASTRPALHHAAAASSAAARGLPRVHPDATSTPLPSARALLERIYGAGSL